MKYKKKLTTIMLLCTLVACSRNENQVQEKTSDLLMNKSYQSANVQNELAVADSTAPAGSGHQPLVTNGKAQAKEDWDKKIIKTGNLSIEVKNYASYNALLHQQVKNLGGYVAQEEQQQSEYKIENTITVKVPADQFENAVAQLSPGTEKIIEKRITSEDVTTEMVDTKSRMEAKKRVRDRYLDLLKQAKNMEEVLQVQNEVNGVQEDIESAGGRISYLGHAAAYSTININFYQVLNPEAINIPEPSYGTRILASFTAGLHWFAELFIVLVNLWPLWMCVFAAVFFVRKKMRTSPAKTKPLS